ncbi:MAG: prefoldin subunit [Candidatus Micrarchaeia archaeon]
MEDIESLTIEYQKSQNRLQSLALQKAQLSSEKEEYKKALEEVEKAQGKVYSSKGNVIIETTKEEAVKQIKEEQDSIDLKLSIIDKQYAGAVKKDQELRSRIEGSIKQQKQ